ncbi:zinc ribbon domain-containing protein [Amphibacillus cookii]|uniref:zinc ribbon domain-containing protein n=1 Tax=Amphibacillus cookii TaxID=767787 RepID=UPI001956CAE7|nr:zinc ribbon domain-containing protein [Amphibacillus cookii]MBM7539767.1 cation transport ATPase [Amphibacillus cookii]
MKCPKCQATLDEDAVFCTHCGAKVQEETATEQAPVVHTPASEVNQQDNVETGSQQQAEQQNQTATENAFLATSKDVGQKYWQFALNAIKQPFQTSLRMTDQRDDTINGIITLVLFAFLFALQSYLVVLNQTYGFLTPSFWDLGMKSFFYTVITFALMILITFGIMALFKIKVSYIKTLTHFAALQVLPTAIALVSLLITLLGSYELSNLLIYFSLLIFLIHTVSQFFVLREVYDHKRKTDVTYMVLLFYVGLYILILLFGELIVASFFYSFLNTPFGL